MFFFQFLTSVLVLILTLLTFLFIISTLKQSKSKSATSPVPRSYPFFGHYFAIVANKDRRIQWVSDMIQAAEPSATITLLRGFLGRSTILTGNPDNVQHILKSNFHLYEKGEEFRSTLFDLLGNGIFNADSETWKSQRQLASHEFNTKSLRKFVETVVDTELNERLIPLLSKAASDRTVLDLQDFLQRFAFDNICKIAFGYDPECLLSSLPHSTFADAFDESVKLIFARFFALHPLVWKIKKVLSIGSERRLKETVSRVRDFAKKLVKEKKDELEKNSSLDSMDLLSRFLVSGHSNEDFVIDVVISFMLAGRDTTSAALTWYFWLLAKNPEEESKILKEIHEKSEMPIFEEVKDMVYTHASLCESMRLYPPVPSDSKVAKSDNVLPDGTPVKKGTKITYHPYAMGRLEKIWGQDWPNFRPERWLEKVDDGVGEKWDFVGRDPYTYPVFQAGPRICLGREMAFLQMKRVVAGVVSLFKVVPATENGEEPVFVAYLSSKMKGGFPVRIETRSELERH